MRCRCDRSPSVNSKANGDGKPLRPATLTHRQCHSHRAVWLFVALLVATSTSTHVQAQELAFSIKCASLATTRLDPIETEGTCADHVNSAFGAVNFGHSVDAGAFQQESSVYTTCSTPFDRSMYWVPALYYETSGDVLSLVEVSEFSVDYFTGRGNRLLSFPVNFRQRAGATSGLWPVSAPEDEAEFQTSWRCRNEERGNSPSASWRDLPSRGCRQLVTQITFPSCLRRAASIYADNDKLVTGAAYPKSGRCPDSHKFQVPALRFNVVYTLGSDWDLRKLVLSTGDRSGSDMHGDFISGWDPYVLESSIFFCENAGSGRVKLPGVRCPLAQHIGTHVRGPLTFSRPLARKSEVPNEDVDNMISLPLASTSSCTMLSSMPQKEKETEDGDSSERPITAAPDSPDSSDASSDALPPPVPQGAASEEEPQDSSDSQEATPPQAAPAIPQDNARSDEASDIPDQQLAEDSSEGDSSTAEASSASDVIPESSQASKVPASSSKPPTAPVDKPVPSWCKFAWCGRKVPPVAPGNANDASPPPSSSSKPPSTPEEKPVPSWCKFAWCGRKVPPVAPENAKEGPNASPQTPEAPSSNSKPPSTPDKKPVPAWCKHAWCGRTTPQSDATAESPEVANPPTTNQNDQGCEGAGCGENQAAAAPPPPPVVKPDEIGDMELPCFGVSCGRSPPEAVDETPTTSGLPGGTNAESHIDHSHTASQESEVKNSTISLPHADVDDLDDVGIKDKIVVADGTLPIADDASDEWVVVDTTKDSSSSRVAAAGIALHLSLILAFYSCILFSS